MAWKRSGVRIPLAPPNISKESLHPVALFAFLAGPRSVQLVCLRKKMNIEGVQSNLEEAIEEL